MPTDYDKIREDNIREYGQGTRHLSFLGRLYTDRTHFVFELLQNAEDAGATRILFSLFDDRLEVTHDGRLFNERDVRGVCGVGEGTKAEDLTQIGKFGIGFKSVYAYTATPEVHSGGEGFRIENYVRPYAVTSKPAGNSWTTLFVFPFNTEEIAPETACKEIGARLHNLSARTLLFLRRINEIEYRLPNSTGGVYLREEIPRGPARQVSVIGQNNGKEEEENWLIFERPLPVPGNSETVRVEVSFRLEAEDKGGKKPERIVKVKDSPLVVYFPTEKATRFGFLIQGPYRTTPSRDNIPKNDEWNETLVKETAELIGDILSEIKDLGLLSVSFLEALPIRTEDFPDDSMFYPIVESVRNTLIKDELLPADDGSFVSAGNAKLARGADLRKLLSQKQLGQLFQSPAAAIKWLAADITRERTLDLRFYLILELDVEEVTPDVLARRINHAFLSSQSDEWFVDFYGYLSGQEALWRPKGVHGHPAEGPLRRKPIIRCQDGRQRTPFDELGNPNVFLPVESRVEYHVVRKSIYENEKVAEFMQRLGIVAPDICTRVLNDIIPLYQDDSEIEDDTHTDHVSVIADAMDLEDSPHYSKMISALKDTTWALATNAKTSEQFYDRPTNLFFQSPELQTFFEENVNIWFLAEQVENIDWQKLGVRTGPVINCRGLHTSRNHFVPLCSYHGWHKRGAEGFDPDTSIDDLEHALMHISLPKAVYIWNELLPPLIRFLHGRYQHATHQNYDNATTYEEDSKLCKMLKNHAWLPVAVDEFKKPSECRIADLVGELKRNEELAEALGVQPDPEKADQDVLKSEDELKREHATELGVSLEDIDFLKSHRGEIEQLKAALAGRKERPTFPTRQVSNPERRQERLGEQLSDAPDKEYEKRERSVRTTNGTIDPITWLRNQYTNEADQMVCQICKEEMPFRKRDGAHYFEKKEVLSKKYLPKEHETQYLALCPLCAAMYEEFVKSDDDAMADLRDKLVSTVDCDIPITLGDQETSIRFVETHHHDLKVIIEGTE
ncbi:sacsin N-terminal ATP-binding-like domain-containing protein [Desulfofustis glycolicus]|uniref:Sacsin/Nov domain-containing protein n=1 Tax=Desulfofustis glycolicus DSM 9705 TaxID=1121409 RepID=A0A1M5W0W3_9BACT|nr:hypothetical protein [Desulfofustis glycolicus]SHH81152.1 hypothetical protein SAMN02745124_02015 [Desulfofustis glycolicus DSM 9705]